MRQPRTHIVEYPSRMRHRCETGAGGDTDSKFRAVTSEPLGRAPAHQDSGSERIGLPGTLYVTYDQVDILGLRLHVLSLTCAHHRPPTSFLSSTVRSYRRRIVRRPQLRCSAYSALRIPVTACTLEVSIWLRRCRHRRVHLPV